MYILNVKNEYLRSASFPSGTSPLRIGFPPPVLGIGVEDEAHFCAEEHIDQVAEGDENEGSELRQAKGEQEIKEIRY
jgi:hypothetical protein